MYRYGDGNHGYQYGSGAHDYGPGPIITGISGSLERLRHVRPQPTPAELVGVQGGPKNSGHLGRVMGYPVGGHKAEWVSRTSV